MVNAATTTLLIGEKTFKLLQSAGLMIPIPGIGAAAQAALTTLEIAQIVRKNKEDFIALGKEACLIMATIIERVLSHIGGGQQIEQAELVKLQQGSNQLLQHMEVTKQCMEKYGQKRSWVKRTVHFNADKEAIQKCKDSLRQSLDFFSSQSDIELRKQIAALLRPGPPIPCLSLPHEPQSNDESRYLSPTFGHNVVGGNERIAAYSDDIFNASGSANNISFSFAQLNNYSNT